MKILFLNYEFPPIGGGGANATRYLFQEFSRAPDLEIDLVTSAWDSSGIENFSDNIRIHKLNIHKKRLHYWTHREILEYIFKSQAYSDSLIKRTKPDLLHAFFGIPAGLIAYWFAKKLPYIVSLRGSDVPGFNNRFSLEYVFLAPLFRKIWNQSQRVIANSLGLKYLAQQTAPQQKIDVIYNGIDIEEFKPGKLQKNLQEPKNLLTVSRLIERKGLDYLIRAIPEIIKTEPEIKLTIIGEGNLEEELKSLAKNLGVGDKVDFLGFCEHTQMTKYYQNAHLFILPSKNEGMSNTVLEAIACGLPIVTTNTGGTAELIKGNGIVIPKENSPAISDAVLKILSDTRSREKMGRKSREIALKFSWKNQADKYLDIYKEIISHKSSR